MAEHSPILHQTEQFVRELFSVHLSEEFKFHTLGHTMEIVNSCRNIGMAIGISDSEMEMLLIAAWFHDVGYTKTYVGHEEISCQMVEEFLHSLSYSQERIDTIKNIIMATKMPQNPSTTLEKIIADADLYNLGSKEFFLRNEEIREELYLRLGRTFTDEEWAKSNLTLLEKQQFWIPYVENLVRSQLNENIEQIKKSLGS